MKVVAFERAKQGTGASRRLRNAGKAPGIIYGGTAEPQLIELDHNALWHALKKEAFHSSVLELEVAGKTSQVVLRDVQYHPYKQQVLHVDFQRVSATEKLQFKVPLHFLGENDSPAVKLEQCMVAYIVTELEVSCLPANLPEFIEVDLTKVVKGDVVKLSQIQLPKGVEAISHGEEDPVLASVVAPKGPGADEDAAEGEEPAAD